MIRNHTSCLIRFVAQSGTTQVDVFIATYLEAEATHILQRMDRGEDGIANANPTQLNQDFLRIFTMLAKRNGLGS